MTDDAPRRRRDDGADGARPSVPAPGPGPPGAMTMTTTAHEASSASALTAENQTAEIDGATLVYRRLGQANDGTPPLICLQHFRGNLDNWDPALVDRLAADREVVLVDNRGDGGSTGAVADNVEDMARDILRFVDALDIGAFDVLGFSLGGYVAQELALVRPRQVRRLVLAGTAPRGAPGIHRWTDDVFALATRDGVNPGLYLRLFFSGSEESVARGREHLGRITARTVGRDAATDLATRDSQLEAIARWGIPDPSQLARLAAITQPVYVAVGDNDTLMTTENSRVLARHLPESQLRVYPDAGHGFLDQYPEQFADHVRAFLNGG
jgi:pimeloyl-ACP methyl ester carboxylesterase